MSWEVWHGGTTSAARLRNLAPLRRDRSREHSGPLSCSRVSSAACAPRACCDLGRGSEGEGPKTLPWARRCNENLHARPGGMETGDQIHFLRSDGGSVLFACLFQVGLVPSEHIKSSPAGSGRRRWRFRWRRPGWLAGQGRSGSTGTQRSIHSTYFDNSVKQKQFTKSFF